MYLASGATALPTWRLSFAAQRLMFGNRHFRLIGRMVNGDGGRPACKGIAPEPVQRP